MGNNQATALLSHMAALEAKSAGERADALAELYKALDPSDPQTNKTGGRTALDNKAVMDALLNLSATTNSADVTGFALAVLLLLAWDDNNANRLFQEHPSLIPVVMRKLEAESATEEVQIRALSVLQNLAFNDGNKREMVTKNPTLISLLVNKVESNSERVKMEALGVLRNLTCNADNAREMAIMLVSLLMAEVKSTSEKVQIKALVVLNNLVINVDDKREMVIKNPTLVPLIVAKMESNLEQVQVDALEVLSNLAFNVDNGREMATNNPALVPLLMAKMESNSEQVKALTVLHNLAANMDNKREMITENPTLVPLLMAKVESNSEQAQLNALDVLQSLAVNVDNKREMVIKNPALLSLLVTNLEQVEALGALNNLAVNVDNAAEIMVACSAVLLPLLVEKMNGNTPLEAIKMVYNLSCSSANRAILRGNNSVIAALTKGRENGDDDTSFFSLLSLINLFGAEEDSEVLKTNLAMLQEIFEVTARAMNKDGWKLNKPLIAFRYLCVVKHNRHLLWNEYGNEFLTSVLAALQRAIDDKDLDAAENAMSTLAQFNSDTEPLAWMRSNKPQLDEVIAQLVSFPEAFKTAQFLQLILDPPKVVAAPVTGSKPTIMISYSWKHQAQARLIHSLLESQGYPVWRDEQNMKADIMTAMTDAVSKSTVVLVLVSPFYKESPNCQMECQFAHNNNRKLIPVLVEPGYVFKADGWLGLLLGSKLYYDVSRFHNKVQMEPIIFNLLRNEVEGGQVATTVPATVAPPVAAAPKQPVPQNEVEIRQWLSKHKHGEEIADKLVKEGLVEAEDLERLFEKTWVELKAAIELNAKQALTLEAALKELF
ncbi:hypothetical protein BASA81_001070 [Batrachochytrium salamandrivorans]|nr:hypothetical protein BASA81_001070 [Batrachochytrium salamandrivorans]